MIYVTYLAYLGFLVCMILVLIKLFTKEGVGLGILGIICFPYTYIWGWINHKKQKITNIMIIGTILLILSSILYAVVGVSFLSN